MEKRENGGTLFSCFLFNFDQIFACFSEIRPHNGRINIDREAREESKLWHREKRKLSNYRYFRYVT